MTGGNGVNNFYDFVGSSSSAPTYSFTGGTGNNLNEAVFANALSNYTITLNGNVHLKQDDRTGLAQQAVFSRAAQTAILTGKAAVRDARSETHANRITFLQNTGDFAAKLLGNPDCDR